MKVDVVINDRELKKLLDAVAEGEHLRIVADGVEYGIYQELGTSKMPAHPFMTPAVEAMRDKFADAVRKGWMIALENVLDKVAMDIVARAKALAPVDTGLLKNSIHVVSGETFSTSFQKRRGK